MNQLLVVASKFLIQEVINTRISTTTGEEKREQHNEVSCSKLNTVVKDSDATARR